MIYLKKRLAKLYAKKVHRKEQRWINDPIKTQEKVFKQLIQTAKNTQFGQDHSFHKINSHKDFVTHVPVRSYEDFKVYIDDILTGKENILWKGRPIYLAKTSGTTSGAKYIPLTKESLPNHIKAAKNAILNYIQETGNANFTLGKMIFLQGSPLLEKSNGIKLGRLSGIVAHYVPKYLQKNRMPSWETNCIEDWETKIDAIVNETQSKNMTLISGIPPWLVMYFERLIEKTHKKNIKKIFPSLQLMITGGVNYEPYQSKINELIGGSIDVIQTYPASEGFIAYQNKLNDESLLLLLNHGIFYEFILADEFHSENPTRITLKDVELNKDYVLLLTTNAGLWAYNIGDTIRFVNKNPYKIIVSGRIKHFTSAFGEHVIAHEVETAIKKTLKKHPAQLIEFTVAPQVTPTEGLPYHEWLIEFAALPKNLNEFAKELDLQLQQLNSYYADLIKGNVLQNLVITPVTNNGFQQYMKSLGKLGGQNKVPRLSNDRKIANEFYNLNLIEK